MVFLRFAARYASTSGRSESTNRRLLGTCVSMSLSDLLAITVMRDEDVIQEIEFEMEEIEEAAEALRDMDTRDVV
jgi:hypothetical protein